MDAARFHPSQPAQAVLHPANQAEYFPGAKARSNLPATDPRSCGNTACIPDNSCRSASHIPGIAQLVSDVALGSMRNFATPSHQIPLTALPSNAIPRLRLAPLVQG